MGFLIFSFEKIFYVIHENQSKIWYRSNKNKLCTERQDKNNAAVEPNGRRKVIQTNTTYKERQVVT